MAETIIGTNISIDGEITGTDSITVLGTVRGRMNVKDQLTIPPGGRVEADVEAGSVEIAGIIEGNVAVSDKLEIKSGGLLVGDVKAPRVLIADGATFKGSINNQ
jgi:cytoskeletal protein CcmA (bactofilin family)